MTAYPQRFPSEVPREIPDPPDFRGAVRSACFALPPRQRDCLRPAHRSRRASVGERRRSPRRVGRSGPGRAGFLHGRHAEVRHGRGGERRYPKPCTARELLARIRAILRRARTAASVDTPLSAVVSGSLAMWPGQRRAERRGKPLPLTSTEFSLLEVLLREAGRPVSKGELSERALGRPHAPRDRSIDVHLSSIRQEARYALGRAAAHPNDPSARLPASQGMTAGRRSSRMPFSRCCAGLSRSR